MASPKAGKAQFAVRIAIQARDVASRVVRGVAEGMRKSFDRVRSSIRSTVDFVAKLGTAFATVGAGIVNVAQRIVGAVTSAADKFGALADVSAKTRVSTAVLQELAYAGQQSGVSTESLYGGIETLNRKLGQMKAGSKELSGFLLRVGGPAFLRQVQGAKSTEEAFETLLLAMGKIEGEEKRAAFAMAAFGKSGEDLALLVANGTDELRKQRTEAHLYAVQSEENVKAAAEFGDELDKLKGAGQFAIDTASLEVMRQLLPDIREINQYFKENREAVVATAREIGGGIAEGVKAIRAGFEWIYENREAILSWAKALAVIFGAGGLLGSITGIVAGLRTMLGLAGGGAAGGAAAAAGGGARAGAALAAGAVGGVALAATLLPTQDQYDQAGQRSRFGKDSFERYRRVANIFPGVDPSSLTTNDGIASQQAQRWPQIFEGFERIADYMRGVTANSWARETFTPALARDKAEVVLTLKGPLAESVVVEPRQDWVTIKKPTGTRTLGGG